MAESYRQSTPAGEPSGADLSARVFQGYQVRTRRYSFGRRAIELLAPANPAALLDDPRVMARFAHDEHMPYWAEVWPASLLLAHELAAWPTAPAGAGRVLELGCGLGLVALLAMDRGYDVIASDYDADALAFVAENARRNGVRCPALRQIDWRCAYPDLRPACILAADVLYERRNVAPIADFLARHMPPAGVAHVADTHRPTADAFPAAAAERGLRVITRPVEYAAAPGSAPVRGRLFEVRR